MNYSTLELWIIILALGAGTYLIRFSFLGALGNRELPPWILRHLRYTAVGILPAMVVPLVVWPQSTGGEPDPIRLSAAALTLVVGCLTRNAVWGIVAGMGSFWALGPLLT